MTHQTIDKVWAFPNVPTPSRPVVFDAAVCNGCRQCVEVCPMDIFLPHPEKGKPPIVFFADECWYCGACVHACPRPEAIRMNFPLMWRVPWKRKSTGEHDWVGRNRPPGGGTQIPAAEGVGTVEIRAGDVEKGERE